MYYIGRLGVVKLKRILFNSTLTLHFFYIWVHTHALMFIKWINLKASWTISFRELKAQHFFCIICKWRWILYVLMKCAWIHTINHIVLNIWEWLSHCSNLTIGKEKCLLKVKFLITLKYEFVHTFFVWIKYHIRNLLYKICCVFIVRDLFFPMNYKTGLYLRYKKLYLTLRILVDIITTFRILMD